ncbi:MAG: GNAT family N-acetyltransferase [Alphaproteobacteria bacterium]
MVEVRAAREPDIEPICRLLHDRMNARLSVAEWRRLMSYGWLREKPDFGVVVEAAGEIAGYLGVVYAERDVDGLTARTGNLTSWYLAKPYRGQGIGMDMLSQATSDPAVTYTTFSSTPRVLPMMERAGLAPLDTERFIWRRDPQGESGLDIVEGLAAVRPRLGPREGRLLDDHAGFNVAPYLIRTPGGTCLVILSIRMKGADVAYHEALYVGDGGVFAAHAAAFANAILPPRPSLVAVDRRFLAGQAVDAEREPIPVPRYARTVAPLAPERVDFLYSEIPLLDLKLY